MSHPVVVPVNLPDVVNVECIRTHSFAATGIAISLGVTLMKSRYAILENVEGRWLRGYQRLVYRSC